MSSYYDRVYDLTKQIPKGKVCTYGIMADYLTLGSARMVGWALNKISLWEDTIPAHRVVNSKGELSGRNAFPTPEVMQERLEREGVVILNHKVVDFKTKLWVPE